MKILISFTFYFYYFIFLSCRYILRPLEKQHESETKKVVFNQTLIILGTHLIWMLLLPTMELKPHNRLKLYNHTDVTYSIRFFMPYYLSPPE